jgi:hypothetical protein
MAKTNERVDPKAFQQRESNPAHLLQALEPQFNQTAIPRAVLVLIFSDHQVCSVESFCYWLQASPAQTVIA